MSLLVLKMPQLNCDTLHSMCVSFRCECPRDPLCVHAAPPLPKVGPSHEAAAV